ncbi:hypothetical protein [Spiroplasma endosymbiont of Nebria brevicollis]|uniref:hypothetical protein n=1 Tax=Spiroplasma endosymbiont of Nebria brevicollis TaxID=3066284 RepID=UPI00313C11AE
MSNIESIQVLTKATVEIRNKRRIITAVNKTENTTLTPNENKTKPGFQEIFGGDTNDELVIVKIKPEKLTLSKEEIEEETKKVSDIIDLLTNATFEKK